MSAAGIGPGGQVVTTRDCCPVCGVRNGTGRDCEDCICYVNRGLRRADKTGYLWFDLSAQQVRDQLRQEIASVEFDLLGL